MDYESAKFLWDRRIKRNDFRRIPHTRDTIKETTSDGLFVHGWSDKVGILFRPDGTVRIVGKHPGYQATTMFYARQLPNYVYIRYQRGYAHGNYVLVHRRSGLEVPFVDGLEFTEHMVRNASSFTPLTREPDVRAPPELRALGRKIKQAWRTQLLTRVRLGLYDMATVEYSLRYGALERGDWLGLSMVDRCAALVPKFTWENTGRVEIPLYDRVKRGFEMQWRRDTRSIYKAIAEGRLTLDFFL